MPDYRLAPDEVLSTGRAGSMEGGLRQSNLAEKASVKFGGIEVSPITRAAGYMDTMQTLNTLAEDTAKAAVWLTEARKVARGDAMNAVERLAERFGYVNEAYIRVIRDLKAHKDPRWNDLAKKVEELTGDMTKTSRLDPVLGNTLLFHRWVKHMIKLTLWTMPAKHPGAAFFIQQISQQGQQYERDHGIFAPWLQDSVVIGAFLRPIMGDRPELGFLKWSSGASNIFTTASGVSPVMPDGSLNYLAALASVVQPQYQAAATFGAGKDLERQVKGQEALDRYGNPINEFSSEAALAAANTLLRSIPLVSNIAPGGGQSAESIPGRSFPRYYSAPRGGRLPQEYAPTQTRDLAPFNTPAGSALDALMRAFGVGLGAVDVAGPVTDVQLAKTVKAGKQHLGKKNAEKRRREEG